MPDFSIRSQQIELMDDLDCQGEVVDQTLRELETINTLLGGNYVTISGIKKLVKNNDALDPISIADLGCGGGDILRLISSWGKKKHLKMNLTGIDANPNIIQFAKNNSTLFPQIQYEAMNIFSDEFNASRFDIIIGTLFFHHFSSQDLTRFFEKIKYRANLGIVINDIHRHWLAYYSIKWLTGLFSRSAMVKADAPLSVLRAFRKKELIDILEKAGITNYSIRWMWAFRWQVIIGTRNH